MMYVSLLAISILVHELGHFLVAKCFGLHVSKLCLFYDFGYPLFSTGKRFSTEYCLGWLPIGGYVRFDNVCNGHQATATFWNVKPWKRLVVSLSGVVANFLVAYICLFAWIRVYVLTNEHYPNTYVMEKVGEVTKGRIDDCLHFFVNDYFAKLNASADFSTRKTAATVQNKASCVTARGEERRHHDSATIFQRKFITGEDLLWRLSGVNIMLFLFNLLPIPPLDGGQSIISICELLSRRRMNDNLRSVITVAGLLLLFVIFILDMYIAFRQT